jgi:hypothetical protein
MKRLYDVLFYFNCGAALAVIILAHMWQMPDLATASVWFALGAVGMHFAAKQVK